MNMKLKKKDKKNKKKRYFMLFIFLIYLSSFCFTVKIYFKDDKHTQLLKYLVNDNSNYVKDKSNIEPFTKLVSFIANIDFTEPITLIDNNYKIERMSSTDENKMEIIEYKDNDELDELPSNNYKEDIKEEEITRPIVYIYNTHQSEEYAKGGNDQDTNPTVMTASYMLREQFNKNSIPSIVEENDILEVLRVNNWNYASSYKVSRMMMESAKEKDESLKYFIDLHRDSVSKSISTTEINGEKYAKILFIVGLENTNYEENLTLTNKLNNMINEKYPGLSRGIYKKKGPGVNGVYNQDFSPNTILIEIGGQDNTIDEVNNTIIAVSEILIDYIKGDINGR